jgi:hypothetical protein
VECNRRRGCKSETCLSSFTRDQNQRSESLSIFQTVECRISRYGVHWWHFIRKYLAPGTSWTHSKFGWSNTCFHYESYTRLSRTSESRNTSRISVLWGRGWQNTEHN